MYVRMIGIDEDGTELCWRWKLVAKQNHGVRIPCVVAVALCRKFANGWQTTSGARPCMGEVTLDECLPELQGLDVTMSVRWHPLCSGSGPTS